MDSYIFAQQLNFMGTPVGSPSKRSCHQDDTDSPVRGMTLFGSAYEESPVNTPTKRAGSREGSPVRTPTKRGGSPIESPSKKPHTPYLGNGSFTPMVEKPAEDDGMTVVKTVCVYPKETKQLVKRKFELDNPKIRPISYEDWLKVKESHERTGVPNVVLTFSIIEIEKNGILECQIRMERVRTLFDVLPTLTAGQLQGLSRKLWKALSEINAYLAKQGLCLNDPALNWGLDESGNVKFFDLLFSKKMTIASGFKFGYEGKTVFSVDDERKIVQLRAFVLMLLFVENFEETSCRLEFENFVRNLYVENKVGDMSISELEAFLSSRL